MKEDKSMPLNPNALPWSVPETNMDPAMDVSPRMGGGGGQQDPRYQSYAPFYPNPHPHPNPMMMIPPRHMGGHGFANTSHMHPMSHTQPVPSFNTARPRTQQYNNNNNHHHHHQQQHNTMNMNTTANTSSMNPIPPVTAPSYKRPRPVVIVVFGYRRVGKTSVAQRIAEVKKYKYISLKPKDDFATISPVSFVSPLVELLTQKNTFEGIVIDDAVLQNKFEPYYVNSVLQKYGLKLDLAVVLDNDLENVKERGVDYEDTLQKQIHPESYEFCASYLQGETICVVECRDKTLDETIKDALTQVSEISGTKETSLTLKEVELMPNCVLECNPTLVTEILEAQNQLLNIGENASFPFSEPNYLLEYTTFARYAYALQSYMITPWIKGDKVSLIGYKYNIYVYLPMYNIIFRYNNAPSILTQISTEEAGKEGIGFIFEATFANEKLYISDLLLLGEKKGSELIVNERIDIMKEKLTNLDDEIIKLLPWYPVQLIETCDSENQLASGVLFINPDGIMFGEYDSRNFLYPLHRKKTVELRIWNGSFNAGTWTFDAYFDEMGNEKIVEGVPVHINDADVSTYCINDGNILECTREDVHSGPNKTRKGAKHYVFQRRCNWTLKPTTMFKQEFFVADPKWPLQRMAQACASIKYTPATRPKKEEEADG